MSSFGTLFRISTYGESHCKSVGVVVDGCPPGLLLTEADIQTQLSRRRPGQSVLTTPVSFSSFYNVQRDEKDKVSIMAGTELGVTLGTPIMLQVMNLDQRPHDYSETDLFPRPSHADYTYLQKYGIKASSGGGRASARETIGRVAAGAIADKYLRQVHGIEIVAFVSATGEVSMEPDLHYMAQNGLDHGWKQRWESWWSLLRRVSREQVDATLMRCPDAEIAEKMAQRVLQAKEDSNSIGGVVSCVIRNVPVGVGEPSFDKLEALLAHAMLSIPATKGFEIGSGFYGTCIPGNIHNDAFVRKNGSSLGTATNFSGGIQGGISNGEDIYFKVAFKPPATIGKAQATASYAGSDGILAARGRHDPCVVPRAVPIVEAMAALVIMDALMIQESRKAMYAHLPRDPIPASLKGEYEQLLKETQNNQ